MGSFRDEDPGVAGALVNAGVPAVIPTMREVADEAALLFTRELYRTLLEGHPLSSPWRRRERR